MFTAKFGADLDSVPLPNSLITVIVTHSSQFATNRTDDPAVAGLVHARLLPSTDKRPPLLRAHFLWIPVNSEGLKGVQSIRVFLSKGAWRNSLELFTLSAIRVVT